MDDCELTCFRTLASCDRGDGPLMQVQPSERPFSKNRKWGITASPLALTDSAVVFVDAAVQKSPLIMQLVRHFDSSSDWPLICQYVLVITSLRYFIEVDHKELITTRQKYNPTQRTLCPLSHKTHNSM